MNANDPVQEPLPTAGVVPLTPHLPWGPDSHTEQMMLSQQARESQRNEALMQQHNFPWHLIAGLALLVTLACGLLYATRLTKRWYQQHKRKPKPQLSGLQQLSHLAQRNLQTTENFGPFFTELTQIVREDLIKRSSIPEQQRTSQELMAHALELPLNDYQRKVLRELFGYADQVKFAQFPATRQEADKALSQAREILKSRMDENGQEWTLMDVNGQE